ncbi:hypothetical protein HEBU111660_05805 [Helicobacter burdigaliensis]
MGYFFNFFLILNLIIVFLYLVFVGLVLLFICCARYNWGIFLWDIEVFVGVYYYGRIIYRYAYLLCLNLLGLFLKSLKVIES